MIIEFISVGTEILLGSITNTNARYLAEECAVLGLTNYFQVTVGDNEGRLSDAVRTALERSDIVLLSGGLGPTEDDITRETVAKVLGREMKEVPEIHEQIQAYFERMGAKRPSDNNWRQAMVIEGAEIVENHNGTAPGMIIPVEGKKLIILMPGPPEELKMMFEESIAPYLAGLNHQVICSKTVKICGMGESRVADAVSDLIDAQTNPTIATYAKGGEVHLRITASGSDSKAARKSIKPIVKELKHRFGEKVYTTRESETLEQHVVGLLKRRKMTVATAESCTGGLIASTIVNVPGASEVFNEGYITYSNEAKQKILGVKKKTLKKDGAVSENCAAEMAKGAAKAAGARAAISVTGIAGPDGGTPEKPVGLVYVGVASTSGCEAQELHLRGERDWIRELTCVNALNALRLALG